MLIYTISPHAIYFIYFIYQPVSFYQLHKNYVSLNFPKIVILALWLKVVGSVTFPGRYEISNANNEYRSIFIEAVKSCRFFRIIIESLLLNRPFSYSEKESQSNDTLLHFVEFSNVHNSDRSFNATGSNLVYKNV